MEKINMFCLPFAGGNKYSYRQYQDHAPSFINIIPLEYAGRGGRVKDPLSGDIVAVLNDLYAQVTNLIDSHKYAIYGHSMGGLLASLLARKLIRNNYKPPVHLFITGTPGPSALSRTENKRHLLGKNEFINELRSLNGMPEEILRDKELLDYLEPVLRADFKVTENYIHTEMDRLDIPMTVITGTEENMKPEDIFLWQKETNAAVDFRRMPGNHFFIHQSPFEIIQIVAKALVVHSKINNHE
jgi:surfactin synthase thioesterase subunit